MPNALRQYAYVGPPEIKARSASQPPGARIVTFSDLMRWLQGAIDANSPTIPATYVIDLDGVLGLADRHSEHVACAAGQDVLGAGEIFFAVDGDDPWVDEISNQSTGYCPEPESWPSVQNALDRIGIKHPARFTTECTFRLCVACGSRNLVKDGFFVCDICVKELPK